MEAVFIPLLAWIVVLSVFLPLFLIWKACQWMSKKSEKGFRVGCFLIAASFVGYLVCKEIASDPMALIPMLAIGAFVLALIGIILFDNEKFEMFESEGSKKIRMHKFIKESLAKWDIIAKSDLPDQITGLDSYNQMVQARKWSDYPKELDDLEKYMTFITEHFANVIGALQHLERQRAHEEHITAKLKAEEAAIQRRKKMEIAERNRQTEMRRAKEKAEARRREMELEEAIKRADFDKMFNA